MLAAMGKTAAGWENPKGRPTTTWNRNVKNDLASLNIDLDFDLRKAQDRTDWHRLVAAVGALAWNLPMMIMIFMITKIV